MPKDLAAAPNPPRLIVLVFVDGVRVRFEDNGQQVGWFLARKSNTEEILVMRIEAVDENWLTSIKQEVDERVSAIIDITKLLTQ